MIKHSNKKHKHSKKCKHDVKKHRHSKRCKHSKTKKQSGSGYIMQVEAPTIGGQTARMGYSQCCPPTYMGGKVAYTSEGNRMCGGGKKRKSMGKKKSKKSRSQRK